MHGALAGCSADAQAAGGQLGGQTARNKAPEEFNARWRHMGTVTVDPDQRERDLLGFKATAEGVYNRLQRRRASVAVDARPRAPTATRCSPPAAGSS